jgi:uncharacterized protein (DUF3820 family)
MNQFRTVNHISDDTAAQAYALIDAHNRQVNPENKNIYESDSFKTYYVISVTGNRRSYYTLYQHYNVNANQFTQKDHYVCNLSTDLIEAVSKICTGKGLPVVLYIDDNFNPERIPATCFPIGKYKGQSLADVYDTDPNYIIWASFNLTPKKNTLAIEMMFQALYHLRDAHFQMITEKNQKTSTSEHQGQLKKRYDLELTIVSRFKAQPTDFQPNPKTKYKAQDANGNMYQFYCGFDNLEIGTIYQLKGTVNRHFTSLGINYTALNRIAINN